MTTVDLGTPPRPPVFINVTVRGNYAAGRGGGMANDLSTSPAIINCVFEENECRAKGGGLYNDFACSPLIVNTIFRRNTAHMAAAVGNDGTSNPLIVGCTITDNVCEDIGAGLYQGSYQANCSISANVPTVINTVIKDNHSEIARSGRLGDLGRGLDPYLWVRDRRLGSVARRSGARRGVRRTDRGRRERGLP